MISESSYWKLPLLKIAQRLAVLTTAKEPNERQLAQLEVDWSLR